MCDLFRVRILFLVFCFWHLQVQDFFPELYATKEFFSVKEFFPPGVSFLELFSFEISLWDIFFYGIRSEEQLPLIMFFF